MRKLLLLMAALTISLSAKPQNTENDSLKHCDTFVCPIRTVHGLDDEYSFLRNTSLYDTSDRLSLRIYEHNFFKNNEYMGDFIKGYTLVGYHFQPELTYNLNSMLQVQVMWNVLKYHGYDNFSEYKPYARIVFKPNRCFTMIGGYLEGNVKHDMLEPIYNPERYYTNNVENGLEFLIHKNRYSGDVWLNWEKFILWGDPWQERLAFGHVSKYRIVDKDYFKANILGEILICHRGGQIDSSDGQVQSLENGALGMELHKYGKGGLFKQLSLRAMFVQYHCIDETPDIPYLDGWGAYAKALLRIQNFGFTCGYWQANRFMNFRGDQLFTCQAIQPENNKVHRYMVFNELYYAKRYFDGRFTLKAGINSYYDFDAGQMEYSYMLSFIFNQKFKIL